MLPRAQNDDADTHENSGDGNTDTQRVANNTSGRSDGHDEEDDDQEGKRHALDIELQYDLATVWPTYAAEVALYSIMHDSSTK